MKQSYTEAMEDLKETLILKSTLEPDIISAVVRGPTADSETHPCSPTTQNNSLLPPLPPTPHVSELPEVTAPKLEPNVGPLVPLELDTKDMDCTGQRLRQFHEVYNKGQYSREPPIDSGWLKGHILFCALGYDGEDALGLMHFVRPLRRDSEIPIVVLGLNRPKDWYTIAESENVFFVAGTPLCLFDLERAGFKSASAIFLSQASVPGEMIDPSIVDAEGIFASRLIESQLDPASDVQVISELVFDSNYVFNPVGFGFLASGSSSSSRGPRIQNGDAKGPLSLDGHRQSRLSIDLREAEQRGKGESRHDGKRGAVRTGGILGQMVNAKGGEPSSPSSGGIDHGVDEGGRGRSELLSQIETSDYFRQARFASGQLFVSSLVTSLVVNTLFNPSLALLVQEMVSAQVVLAAAPAEYKGKSYLQVFKWLMLKRNLIAMGLYRRSESFAYDLGHPKNKRQVLPHYYMFTAPPAKDTIVAQSDRILCIAAPGGKRASDEL
jgi:hypothetical protein